MYCGFSSENAAKEALVSRYPRDSYTLATKLHSGFIQTKEDRDKIFKSTFAKVPPLTGSITKTGTLCLTATS
mgnify:CR=1 FL=1